jgi:hypothetical protein
MNMMEIANIRLTTQQISPTKFKSVKDIVDWMGAIQAQDFSMAKWAIGIRLPGSTDQMVETAINNGEIIWTHLLRPTWHFVSADDIYWMIELTAPQIKASLRTRHKELELSETIFSKSNTIIEKALAGGQYLTREEIMTKLGKANIATDENRGSHLILRGELDGIVCSGAIKDGKQTYTLLEERVPKTKPLTKEEALAKLARKYFSSHCPATLQDFVWWSGLPMIEAKQALEMVKADLVSETIDSQTYWFTYLTLKPKADRESVYLLPAYDEFLISYKNRSASFLFENHKKTISNNGIFRPVIVVNGQVIGIWKRIMKKDKVIVEAEFFKQIDNTTRLLLEREVLKYSHFMGKKTDVKYNIV